MDIKRVIPISRERVCKIPISHDSTAVIKRSGEGSVVVRGGSDLSWVDGLLANACAGKELGPGAVVVVSHAGAWDAGSGWGG